MLRAIGRFFKKAITNLDPVLFVCVTLLSLISVVTIAGMGDLGKRTLIMQIAMSVMGAALMLVIATLDYHWIVDKLWIVFIGVGAIFLIITLIFGRSGVTIETGNKSWLEIPVIGIMIQPSEFVKFLLVCSFAKHLSIAGDDLNKPKHLLLLALHAGAIVGLILLSGDLGVALVYMGFLVIMLFCAGLSPWYFLGGLGTLVIAFPAIWNYFLKDYQRERIIVGFNPELDPMGKGQQPLLSKQCIENGGWFGIGFANDGAYVKNPASHTDFIYSSICEKFGFFAGILVIILMLVIVVRIFIIAYKCGKDYGAHICIGVGAIILVQTAENIGMCLAMVPVVGITLPFVSAGGSSMLATYLLIALVHCVRGHCARSKTADMSLRRHKRKN